MNLKEKTDAFIKTLDEETGKKVRAFLNEALFNPNPDIQATVVSQMEALVMLAMREDELAGPIKSIGLVLLYIFEEGNEIRYGTVDAIMSKVETLAAEEKWSKQSIREFLALAGKAIDDVLQMNLEIHEAELQ